MKITEVRVKLSRQNKLRGFANVTFDHSFVVRGVKIIEDGDTLFISMPSRRRQDGSYQDLAHPVTPEMRCYIETRVIEEFHRTLDESSTGDYIIAELAEEEF